MPEISPFVLIAASYQVHRISITQEVLFHPGVFECGEMFRCSDWHEIAIWFRSILMPVRTLCRTPQAAAVCSLLKEAAAAEDASRAAVHVESCDDLRSRKAQCQKPPDNPKIGDTYEYHSREKRICAGQKIVYSTNTYTDGAAAAAVRVYRYVCIQAGTISTNSRSMEEECQHRLPSGTCFTARRLEVVAVAGPL